jgi:transposase
MRRYELSERKWTRIAPLMPHRTHHGEAGHPFNDPRPIVNGILWVLHTGAPWRDLPERYGPWETVFKGFNRWREDGTWVRIVTSLLDELDDRKQIDHDLWCIDGPVIRASRAAAGGGKKEEQLMAAGRTQRGANARATGPCARAFAGRIRHQGPPGV